MELLAGVRLVIEASDSSSEASGTIFEGGNSSSSSSSSFSSSSSEAEAWSAMIEGSPRFEVVGADFLRGAVVGLVALEVLEIGRGGLKVGALRLSDGLEAVWGMMSSHQIAIRGCSTKMVDSQ